MFRKALLLSRKITEEEVFESIHDTLQANSCITVLQLDLSGNSHTDHQMMELVEVLRQMENLRVLELNLMSNKISNFAGNQFAKALSKMTQLNRLRLEFDSKSFSKTTTEALRAAIFKRKEPISEISLHGL